MSNSGRSLHESATWVANTGIFIGHGRQQNELTLVICSYTNSTVTAVIDGVSSYIAYASNRSEEYIEKADTALAGVAVEANGFPDQVDVIDGFDLTTDLTA